MIVVDASIIIDLYTAEDQRAASIQDTLATGGTLHAPHLIDVEVAGVMRREVLHGRIEERVARRVIAAMDTLDLQRYPHQRLMGRAWELMHAVTISDALYVALAETLSATLFTSDERLARAPGVRARVLVPGG